MGEKYQLRLLHGGLLHLFLYKGAAYLNLTLNYSFSKSLRTLRSKDINAARIDQGINSIITPLVSYSIQIL